MISLHHYFWSRAKTSELLPLFDIDHLEIVNCFTLSTVYYILRDFGHPLFVQWRCDFGKSQNCTETRFNLRDSVGGLKLIGQILTTCQH